MIDNASCQCIHLWVILLITHFTLTIYIYDCVETLKLLTCNNVLQMVLFINGNVKKQVVYTSACETHACSLNNAC